MTRDVADAPTRLDRFLIAGRLGAGGMGTVYEARDEAAGTPVALKLLNRVEPASLYRFKREFRALADISHPNLVSLYELVATDDCWFFTMELVDGCGALDYLDAGDRAGFADRARNLVRQLASGLMALHAAGRLHRDVKPSNVLVTQQGRVILLDFGVIAELAEPWQAGGQVMLGTPAYMAPEQATPGAELGPPADWYAVGALLYRALTGEVPFAGKPAFVLEAKRTRDPRPVLEIDPDAPPDLAALCMDLLARDPAARPTGPELLERIGGRRSVRASTAVPDNDELLGREGELAALRAAFDRTVGGAGLAACVHGRAGFGKTSLVRELLARIAADDPSVAILQGRCYERESVPYKAIDSLVDALARYLADRPAAEVEAILPRDVLVLSRVFPVLGRIEAVAVARRRVASTEDPHELRRRAVAALRDLFVRLAETRPVVLFIDDLQWGDLDSVGFLDALIRPPAPPALLLICAYRSEDAESSQLLRALFRRWRRNNAAVDQIEVGALDEDAALALAERLLSAGDAPDQSADRLVREAGGHPYLLHEIVRYLRTASNPRLTAGRLTLEAVIGERVAQLPERARLLAEVIAVAGRPMAPTIAVAAAGLTASDAEAATRELVVARVVRRSSGPAGDRIAPFHDRIRETIAGDLPEPRRRAHHRALAEALAGDRDPDAEALATHWHAAGDDAEAARWAEKAAGQAARALAFDRAVELYELALELGDGDPDRRLRIALAEALANAGRGARAAEIYAEAAADAAGDEALELTRRAAEQWLRTGHLERGLDAIRAVLADLDMQLAPTRVRALVSFLRRRIWLRLRGTRYRLREPAEIPPDELFRIDVLRSVAVGIGLIDPVRGADFQTRNLLLSLRLGEPSRVAVGLALEAAYSASGGGATWSRTQRYAAEARALAASIDDPFAIAFSQLVTGTAAFLRGDWIDARDGCSRAEEMLRDRCTGVAWELASAHTFLLGAKLYLGELAELAELVPRYLEEAEERGDLYAATQLRTGRGNVAWLIRDRPDRAGRQLDRAAEEWAQTGFTVQHYYLWMARVHLALYTGDAEAAWRLVEEAWKPMARSLLLRVQTLRISAWDLRARAALARHAAGGGPELLAVADRDVRRLRGERLPWSDALAAAVAATAAASRGDRDGARTGYATAAELATAAAMRPLAIACETRAGQLDGDDSPLSELAGLGVGDPARFAAVLLPAPAAG